MKILITTVQVPFIEGGAELLAGNLKRELIKKGHETEIVTIPFIDSPLSAIPDHIVATRLMNLEYTWSGKIDLLIGLKFPAYFIPHPNKVIWALHQHRTAYDLFDTEYSNIKNTTEGNEIREIVTNADNQYIKEAKRIYTISKNVTSRLIKYNNINSVPLYHPCPDMEKFYCEEYENYILMPSRINITKRQKLAIKAMQYVKSSLKLFIVGAADSNEVRSDLIQTIKDYKVEDKVQYLGHVEQCEKFKLYANARAVLFIPIDEDYGYITLEAMASKKASITTIDSGGSLEFIENNVSGYISKPDAKELAKKIDLFDDKKLAKDMGNNAFKRLKHMGISWDAVIKELTK